MDTRTRDVLQAALTGVALGTATSGLRAGHVHQLTGTGVEGFLADPLLFPSKPERNYLPGLHGAAGQSLLAAIALMGEDSLGRDSVGRVGQRCRDLAGEEPSSPHDLGGWRQPGRPLRRSLGRWRANFPWAGDDYMAASEASEGIGPSLLGLVPCCLGLPDAASCAARLARLTHFRLMAVSGAAAVAYTSELILSSANPRRADMSGIMREVVRRLAVFEDEYTDCHATTWRDLGWGRPRARLSAALEVLPTLLRESRDDLAASTILAAASGSSPACPVTHVQHGFVPAGLTWALYRGLGRMPARLAVEDVLNRGGESGVIAGIVAGLLVARLGAECLPDEWHMQTRGRDLMNLLIDGPSEDSFTIWVSNEVSWTREEDAMREPLRQAIERQSSQEMVKGKAAKKKPTEEQHEEEGREASGPAPPPHLWLKAGDEEDPLKKRILKEARGRRRIGWKEERRRNERKKK